MTSPWSLVEYCASQLPFDFDSLPEPSREFLERLGLANRHPFCNETFLKPLLLDDIPSQGPLLFTGEPLHDSWWDAALTWFLQHVPPYLSFIELWLRFLAGWVAPVAVLYTLVYNERFPASKRPTREKLLERTSLIALACSTIVMTDSN